MNAGFRLAQRFILPGIRLVANKAVTTLTFCMEPGMFGTQPQLRTLSAGALLPVGQDGATLSAEYTDSLTQVFRKYGIL